MYPKLASAREGKNLTEVGLISVESGRIRGVAAIGGISWAYKEITDAAPAAGAVRERAWQPLRQGAGTVARLGHACQQPPNARDAFMGQFGSDHDASMFLERQFASKEF